MNKDDFDDETLMAFADGELDEARSLALEEALATDEALAERLTVFLDSRRLVGEALKPLIDEPVPEALLASVRKMAEEAQSPRDNIVVSFRPKPQQMAQPTTRPWLMPVAASLVALVTGVIGFTLGSMGPSATDSAAEIAAALDREVSGRDIRLSGAVLHVVATFRDERGELCREYELKQEASSTLTVACRQDGAWATRLALTTPQAEGYVPASTQETIDTYLTSIQAGAPLSAEEERKALAP
ncbi:anti-sigma factor [Shinella sp. HZN7]|uniref:anti-sigma factor family protein n=1 Tax=Shinella sp. (strain HZN7) TaxID=879274 RepID=UPI0007DA5151|nr:hypothetical protein [Shinella sp. HZN7]ANH03400.1 hypothetical protein shn_04700 [Shinella sp. HZN7]